MNSRTSITDAELLSMIGAGDEMAFTILFERYRKRLYLYLLKHCKSPEIAEEIVTDIFMKLWIGRDLATQIADIAAFLHKVGYYKVMDFLKTTARHNRLREVYINRLQLQPEQRADERLMSTEQRALLYKAINQLPPQRKLIYKLSREEGMTHEQIAAALNLSRSTVNNSLVSATHSVLNFLQEHAPVKATLLFFFIRC